jgi:hypothetical protein
LTGTNIAGAELILPLSLKDADFGWLATPLREPKQNTFKVFED